jgi:DNA repair exonuclease SbcCD nuclease subunit
MKILITGDWHIGCLISGVKLEEEIIRIAKIIVDKSTGCDLFVHLGDLFHYPKPSPTDYSIAIELFRDIICPTVIIKGNHEETSNKISALEPIAQAFYGRQDFIVVEYPTIKDFNEKFFHFCPYMSDANARDISGKKAQELVNESFESCLKSVVDMSFSHLDVSDATLGSEKVVMRGGSLQFPWEKTSEKIVYFNGHHHNSQTINKQIEPGKRTTVFIPGSIVPTDFGQRDNENYFVTYTL